MKTELIYHTTDGKYFPQDVCKVFVSNHVTHPQEKPLDLVEYFIRTYSNEGETILDPTMGSGTTAVAAKNLGRNFIGYELDENFFNIAKKRLEAEELSKGQNLFGEGEESVVSEI